MTSNPTPPQTQAPEISALGAALGTQQHHVRGILDGLDEPALRRRELPSGWSPLGLMHHLGAMHQFWFRDVLGDEHLPLPSEEGTDFGLDPAQSSARVLAVFDQEAENALAVLRSLDLDTPPAWWPDDVFGGWRLDSQREVVLHVVTELSTHAGQLDVVRELIDGRTWSYALGRVAEAHEKVGIM
ncbi:DUF664 domain-containing protein [Demetria terragena]|uniref:mycothiol transferase n=1 Tax=Demetria terragena TaxID=63959 RepID=UPI00036F5AF3|nr:DUF664 domain-containing protein [Demetria terragena]